ncbi:MAG TPA: hypothetical protein PLO53_14145, partial [Candidatus Hydrogenedentes bacterium]|nr:hypothetical protein [Candidatus Hydrogenedentota bacterium]
DRGMLGELVTHEQDGLVCSGTPESLAGSLLRLIRDGAYRAALGQQARKTALQRFSLEEQARHVHSVYLDLVYPEKKSQSADAS